MSDIDIAQINAPGEVDYTEAAKAPEVDPNDQAEKQAADLLASIEETQRMSETPASGDDEGGEETPAAEEKPAEETIEEKVAEAAGLNIADIAKQFDSSEGLAPETVDALAKSAGEAFGLSETDAKGLILQHFQGITAQRQAGTAEVLSVFPNGQEGYNAALTWAQTGMTAEEITAFNTGLETATDVKTAKAHVSALKAKYDAAHGTQPARTVEGNTAPVPSIKPIRSQREFIELMRTDQYKKDPNFRASVKARLSAGLESGVFDRRAR